MKATDKALPLGEYIEKYYGGNRAEFARGLVTANGKHVQKEQIYQWEKKGFIVWLATGKLYSPRRDLPEVG